MPKHDVTRQPSPAPRSPGIPKDSLHIKLPVTQHRLLAKAALRANLSMAEYTRRIIAAALEEG